ncbi:hypothetical protein CROQUDRAFT_672645 [Cronartium quercuum f. sp. fusiforme G11]|uniref:GPI mannosyltransferase 1 n=1 Tax=Cronartium quercuum f. sp. fusiforme G11 TaxID=708437 RepID=A0A9P6T9T9_9BASI|nr:hypothetical protein CROQUDRAFT_672645 [Cronartium quercuum f. sp. fusiforme G11]
MTTAPFIWFGLLPALVLRLILVIYSVYHDRHSSLKYTDIDYQVYSDASTFILSPPSQTSTKLGPLAARFFPTLGSPYERDTYRYTPLLALLLLPNQSLHPSWGKLVFSFADLIIGILLYALVRQRPDQLSPSKATLAVTALWLLNPIIANISTRGSSEAILGVMVISCLYLSEREKWTTAAMMLGLAVHFKIYPLIYGASIWTRLGADRTSRSIGYGIFSVNWMQFRFSLIAIGTLFALNGIMYLLWGYDFLQHSYFYHLHRLDHRHNFSPYFYSIYLRFFLPTSSGSKGYLTSVLRSPLISFVPQFGLSLGIGLAYGAMDLRFAWFAQTLAFVGFNKVVTSQYFLWYLWFIPLVLTRIHFSRTRLSLMISSWIITQALWLGQAYRLEFLGQNVFREVWICSLLFFITNAWILGCVLQAYSPPLVIKSNVKVE